jgi:hypothetical protein
MTAPVRERSMAMADRAELLFPPDDDVAGAVAAAAGLMRG